MGDSVKLRQVALAATAAIAENHRAEEHLHSVEKVFPECLLH